VCAEGKTSDKIVSFQGEWFSATKRYIRASLETPVNAKLIETFKPHRYTGRRNDTRTRFVAKRVVLSPPSNINKTVAHILHVPLSQLFRGPRFSSKQKIIQDLITQFRTTSLILILEGHAFEVTALESPAGEFSCLFVQTGEARPVEHFVTSLNALGERVGRSKYGASVELRFT
jgi:hypothetical protein